MDVSEAEGSKQLEDENGKLKKLLAEQMLDVFAMRKLLLLRASLNGKLGWLRNHPSSVSQLSIKVCFVTAT